jgi:hypothetical protein
MQQSASAVPKQASPGTLIPSAAAAAAAAAAKAKPTFLAAEASGIDPA